MSARDVMNDARIANGINTVQGLEALMEDYGRLSEENSELREKNAELRDDADGYKGVEQALDLLMQDYRIDLDAGEGTDYWEDQVYSIRVAIVGMRRICDAVARAVGDDGRRYTVDELAEKLKERLMPEGYEWPRLESGEPVRVSDVVADKWNGPGFALEVDAIAFTADEVELRDESRNLSDTYEYGERVKRPQLQDRDGKIIRDGDTVYGQSDGKAWTVTGFNWDNPDYLVHAVGEHGAERDLNPEWLTHERPENVAEGTGKYGKTSQGGDSWERLEKEYGLASDMQVFAAVSVRDLLRRAEKLAGVDE